MKNLIEIKTPKLQIRADVANGNVYHYLDKQIDVKDLIPPKE